MARTKAYIKIIFESNKAYVKEMTNLDILK